MVFYFTCSISPSLQVFCNCDHLTWMLPESNTGLYRANTTQITIFSIQQQKFDKIEFLFYN